MLILDILFVAILPTSWLTLETTLAFVWIDRGVLSFYLGRHTSWSWIWMTHFIPAFRIVISIFESKCFHSLFIWLDLWGHVDIWVAHSDCFWFGNTLLFIVEVLQLRLFRVDGTLTTFIYRKSFNFLDHRVNWLNLLIVMRHVWISKWSLMFLYALHNVVDTDVDFILSWLLYTRISIWIIFVFMASKNAS